jgi:methylthioribose-1-phosphate isomerase
MVKAPLLFEPIRIEGRRIQLLDETQLPDQEIWVPISSLKELLKAVTDMKTRAFGQVLALAYGFILGKNEGWSPEEVLGAFSRSRPTFPFEAIGRQILAHANQASDITQGALSFIEATLTMRRKRAERLAHLLPDQAHILTHCHISGELGLALSIANETGKHLKAYPTITRPYGQGVRLSAPECLLVGVATELLADNAVYQAFQERKINLVIIGSDRSSQEGDILNKVGSFAIAFLARRFQVPVFALVQEVGAGKSLPSPIPIEFRAPE